MIETIALCMFCILCGMAIALNWVLYMLKKFFARNVVTPRISPDDTQ